MNGFTKEKIIDYADKLLISLNDKECQDLLDEFDVINSNMELISKIEGLSEIEPLSFPQEIRVNELRCDEKIRNIDTSDALKNSDGKLEDVIEIPKVVG